jgi:hypothetical protein
VIPSLFGLGLTFGSENSIGYPWTIRNSVIDFGFSSVAYGNGHYVAVGGGNYALRSTDGINWVGGSEYPGGSADIRDICFGTGWFVAVCSDGRILVSSDDGYSWNTRTNPISDPEVAGLNGVCYNTVTATFMAVGTYVLTADSTTDTWTQVGAAGSTMNSVAVDPVNGVYVACGSNVIQVAFSVNAGVDWTEAIYPSMLGLNDVTFSNGVFFACGKSTSPNGSIIYAPYSEGSLSFTSGYTPGDTVWSSISFNEDGSCGVAVAVPNSSEPQAISSIDNGLTWADHAVPSPNEWVGVGYGNNLFVAVAQNGIGSQDRIMTAPG